MVSPLCALDASDVEAGAPFAIDPAVIEDDGRLWMSYGSHYSGIWLVEAWTLQQDASRTRPPGNPIHRLLLTLPAIQMILRKTMWRPPLSMRTRAFTIFLSTGISAATVSTAPTTFEWGEPSDIQGPYLDKDGVAMAEGGGSLFLGSEGRFVGPGHAGISDIEGFGLVFSFHFYDQEKDGEGTLGIRALRFESGWPVLEAAALGRQ